MSTYDFRFHPDARRELDGAATWYDQELQGLSEELFDAVDDAISRITENPFACQSYDDPAVDTDVRRFVLTRFPYTIIYTVEPAIITVVAVAHTKKVPGYWKGRVLNGT